MLLAAGLFPALERWTGGSVAVLPPIVLTYLVVTALAVCGLWRSTPKSRRRRKCDRATDPCPAVLLMVNCDLRAIFALVRGCLRCSPAPAQPVHRFPRHWLVFRNRWPAETVAPTGGGQRQLGRRHRNLVAVKHAIGMSDYALALALLTDALCIRCGWWCCSRSPGWHLPSIAGRVPSRARIRGRGAASEPPTTRTASGLLGWPCWPRPQAQWPGAMDADLGHVWCHHLDHLIATLAASPSRRRRSRATRARRRF